MKRLNGDLLTGSTVLLFGAAAFGMSFTIGNVTWGGESSRLFPMIVSFALMCFGARLVLTGVRGPASPIELSPEIWRVIGLALLGILYVAAIGRIGYIISTGIAAPVALWIFGVRSRAGLAVAALLCPLIYHLVFFVALNVYPPYPSWLTNVPWLDSQILRWNS